MKTAGNTVLITGGASGIGLALAERFLQAGSEVIVCGRREEKLREAKEKFPSIHTRVCDVASEADRISLFNWVTETFPNLNVLINNAGIQNRGLQLTDPKGEWEDLRREITINVEAPLHLSLLFLPHLQRQQDPVIVNVTSGLAFTPAPFAPIYSATKAALHSYTMSMRVQLAKTNVQVLEVIPPAVNTDLGGPGLHTFGVPLDEFADAIFAGLGRGDLEIAYGTAEKSRVATREEIDAIMNRMVQQ